MHARWNGAPGVHFIPEFYDVMGLRTWLADNGIKEEPEGIHDEFAMAAMMAAVDPNSIRPSERRQAGLFRINGVDLDPLDETVAWGSSTLPASLRGDGEGDQGRHRQPQHELGAGAPARSAGSERPASGRHRGPQGREILPPSAPPEPGRRRAVRVGTLRHAEE